MPEYVRVRDKATGHHYSIPAQQLKQPKVAAGVEVLDQPAGSRTGALRKPVYNVPKGQGPAPSATTASKPRRTPRPAPDPVPTPDLEPEAHTDGRSADTTEE